VLRILIQKYGASNSDLLMKPINSGLYSKSWQKRNSSLILCGEMLEVIQKQIRAEQIERSTKG